MAETQNKALENANEAGAAGMGVETPAEMPAKSKRQMLRERMKAEYPDDDYETDDDGELLGGRLMDRLDQNDAQLQKYRENDARMKQMFVDNPATARFFTRWGAGDDPVDLMAEIFGDKLKETVESPDAEQLLKNGMQKYFAQVKKSKDATDEFERNAEETMKLLQQRDSEATPEDIDNVFETVLKIAAEAVSGKISAETIDMVMKALNHDKNVNDAREEGMAAGRNERYQEKLRQRDRGDGQPAAGSGSSQRSNPDRQMRRASDALPRSAWESPEQRNDW